MSCFPDTIRDILESYVQGRSGRITEIMQDILDPAYFESFSSTLFSVIKQNRIGAVSNRRFTEIRMLTENFDALESHFLSRYRLTATDWNSTRTAELRRYLAEINTIVRAFVVEQATRFDTESLLAGSELLSGVLWSEAMKQALVSALPDSARIDERGVQAFVWSIQSIVLEGADPYVVVAWFARDSQRHMKLLQGRIMAFCQILAQHLRPLWYTAEEIDEVTAELEVSVELLLEIAEHPDEARETLLESLEDEKGEWVQEEDGPNPDDTAVPITSAKRVTDVMGAEKKHLAESVNAIEPVSIDRPLVHSPAPSQSPWKRGRPTRSWNRTGLRMTGAHIDDQGQPYWHRVMACMRHDHVMLFGTWVRSGVISIDTVHPLTKRTLLHFAVESGAIRIMRFILRRKADWNAQDIEGWEPLERLMFQKPLHRDFFIDLMRLTSMSPSFRAALTKLSKRIDDVSSRIKDEARRADFDFLSDHIAMRIGLMSTGIDAWILPTATVNPSDIHKTRVRALYQELFMFGGDQRDRLAHLGLSHPEVNNLFLWLAKENYAAIDFTSAAYAIDADDTDIAILIANKDRIQEYMTRIFSIRS